MQTKPNLLIIGDSPTVNTGFANVVRNLAMRWHDSRAFEKIDIWGINYSGFPHKYPYGIYPGGYGDWVSDKKLSQLLNLIGESDYTHLFILQDSHCLAAGNFKSLLREMADKKGISITHYYPVDAPLIRTDLDLIATVDHAVTYTEYGRKETVKARPGLSPHVIPHGVDTSVFYPKEDRPAVRERCFSKGWLKPDDFLIVNVNRNERRKAPHHSLQILAELQKMPGGHRVKMLLHMPRKCPDDQTDLEAIGARLGVPVGKAWHHHDKFCAAGTGVLTNDGLNDLYNSADLVLSTSLGEGWGLCVEPKTPVRTPTGYAAIKDLKAGDLVLTTEGFKSVKGTASRHHRGKAIEIVADNRALIMPLVLTPEHPVLTLSGWKMAKDVSTKDRLVMASDRVRRCVHNDRYKIDLAEQFTSLEYCRSEREIWHEGSQNKRLSRRVVVNKDFSELYGIYLAEGSASKNGIVFSISQEEQGLTDRIIHLVKNVWGLDCAIENCPKSKKRWVRIYSKILTKFYAESCGSGARNKRIGIFELLGRHTAAKVLKGIWLGDGSDDEFGYSITTCSREMAFQIIALGDKLGIRFALAFNAKRRSYCVKTIHSYVKNFSMILDDRRYWNGVNKGRPNNDVGVRLVREIDYDGEVCDIQVDGCHNFMTDHCVVHNSGTEAPAAGTRVAWPAHTACKEIAEKFESLGQKNQMTLLPLSPQCSVNMWDLNRVRYPVDVIKSAEVIMGLIKDENPSPTCATGTRFVLNDAVKEWLSWDRISQSFLGLMIP